MPFQRRMRRLPLRDIRMTDRFWSSRQETLRNVTLVAEYRQLESTGRLQNFLNVAAGSGEFQGLYFNDSDVYKWCEAAAYALALAPSAELSKMLDDVIGLITAAQEPDGYLNTFFQLKHPNLKWRNLVAMHEMYCAGHLIEAGVALFDSLGDRRLLDVSIKLADHIMSVFGPGKRRGYCGHQELELALIRLADSTADASYREFAKWMIEERGKSPSALAGELSDEEAMSLSPWIPRLLTKSGSYSGEYAQDHAPIREHTEIVGHAVRAMYYYIAATQLASGDPELESALERIWENLTRKRMYITGGIGPSASNEGFTGDYDLPNLTAYAETCASIGLVFWGQALLEQTGNSEYADIVERALYNGVPSGISLGGDQFFYTNRLESRGKDKRVEWFECACCPPNIARLFGSVAWYVASISDDAFWIHVPAGFEASTQINGVDVRITCESDYPWEGKFKIRVEPASPVRFDLKLRIPEWADEVDTELPGLEEQSAWEGGYAVFTKLWKKGDVLTVDLGMQSKWVECHPKVQDNVGRVAMVRGPLVFCAEEQDNGFAPQLFVADTEAPLEESGSDLFGGIVTVQAEGFADREEFVDELYSEDGTTETAEATLTFIPYHSWSNRGPSHMQVWVRRA